MSEIYNSLHFTLTGINREMFSENHNALRKDLALVLTYQKQRNETLDFS